MRKPDSSKRTSQASREDTPPESSSLPPPSTSPPNDTAPTLRRKKKIIQDEREDDIIDLDSDNSDGDEADAEFGGIRGGTPWVSVSERRRKSTQTNPIAKARADDVRRHSLAA